MAGTSRVALVTGGRRGIGLGIARRLALDGFDVAICGTSAESGAQDALAEIRACGGEPLYVQADVASAADRAALLAAVRVRYGRLDVLVNNAGVAPRVRADILAAGEDEYDRVMAINLNGPYFLTQAAGNWMVEQKRLDGGWSGTIVFVTSMSVTVASVNRGEYCISKAGLAMASRLFAVRMAEYDVAVYEVRPGIVATDMTAKVKDTYDRLFAEGLTLQRRWGTPEDLGRAVAALARGDFAYATGQTFIVDGGLTVGRL